MKTPFFLSAIVFAVFGSAVATQAADSKRTAEYILSTPLAFEGKQVTLDVAVVQPAKWKSPFPELSFFHALTIDRADRKSGGDILVAVPVADAGSFAKKYGTDFEGRWESDQLKGYLLAAGPRKIWVIDMSGQLQTLMAERKVTLPEDIGGRVATGGGLGRFRKP